jgi:hypothetical protein
VPDEVHEEPESAQEPAPQNGAVDDDLTLAVEALSAEKGDADVAETPAEPEPAEVAPEPAAETPAEPEPAEVAPEPAAETPAEPAQEPAPVLVPEVSSDIAPAWPFLAHGGLWVVFSGLLLWKMLGIPEGVPTYEATYYPFFLLAGLTLTAVGPFLIVAVWLSLKRRAKSPKDLFISAMYRGAVATMAGVALWWAALLVIDQIRLGRLL